MGTHPIFESDFDCLTVKKRALEAKMSDTEAPAAAAPAPVAQGYSVETAVQETLKQAQHRDGLARGLNEAVRALERRDAICCILAENCDEANYVRLMRLFASSTRFPSSRSETTRPSASGPAFARSTAKARPSRSSDARALLFVRSTTTPPGTSSRSTSRSTKPVSPVKCHPLSTQKREWHYLLET